MIGSPVKRGTGGRVPRKREPTPPMTKGNMQVRVVTMAVMVALVFLVLGSRLWYLQVLTGEDYNDTAQRTYTREVKIPAQRGVVYDRNGKVLANNVPGLNVTIIPDAIGRDRVAELADILEADKEEVLKQYDAALDPATGNRYGAMLIRENADKDDVTYISERTERFPGVTVNEDWVRSYPQGSLAAHVLGYTGAVTEDELKSGDYKGLSNDSVVGKSGVELEYEDVLRGDSGSKQYKVDALGRTVTVRRADGTRADGAPEVAPELGQPDKVEQPQPGNDLTLTIDTELQKAAEDELEGAMARAQAEGTTGEGGAVIAMDPRNGEILAMASRPNFDPQLFVGGIAGQKEADTFKYLNSEEANSPFTNRAIAGAYPGASTFKVFTGLAGFTYGVIDAYTTVTDPGGCFEPTGTTGSCFYSWKQSYLGPSASHGTQNFAEAVMDSNDKFFYQVADWIYQKTNDTNLLPEYYKKFGFGSLTGIDLAGESEGRVPTKQWYDWYKKETLGYVDRPWGIGDWINLSIGQGDLLVSPVQMAQAYSAVENGGTLVTPHVGKTIKDQNGKVVREISPDPEGKVEFDPEARDQLLKGLSMVTGPDGTAAPAFADSKLEIIGKSGTGERYNKDPVNWFAGWAPDEEKPLVVVVMVEGGEHSEVTAAPAVRGVLESYYGVEKKTGPSDSSIVAAYANSGVQ